jgi:hypothetical protein
MIYKKSASLLDRVHGDRGIAGAPADTAERICLFSISFGASQFAVRRPAPKVGAGCLKESSSKCAERPNQLTCITALEGRPGKIKEKLLESFVRVRRALLPRDSRVADQSAPFVR